MPHLYIAAMIALIYAKDPINNVVDIPRILTISVHPTRFSQSDCDPRHQMTQKTRRVEHSWPRNCMPFRAPLDQIFGHQLEKHEQENVRVSAWNVVLQLNKLNTLRGGGHDQLTLGRINWICHWIECVHWLRLRIYIYKCLFIRSSILLMHTLTNQQLSHSFSCRNWDEATLTDPTSTNLTGEFEEKSKTEINSTETLFGDRIIELEWCNRSEREEGLAALRVCLCLPAWESVCVPAGKLTWVRLTERKVFRYCTGSKNVSYKRMPSCSILWKKEIVRRNRN